MPIVRPLTVHWHEENGPIYSAVFQPGNHTRPNRTSRLVTAGGDTNLRVWRLKFSADFNETPQVEYLATLADHNSAVNCAAFDPSGNLLASSGDDGVVRIWTMGEISTTIPNEYVKQNLGEFDDSETWRLLRLCRCATLSEVYDLAWSPSGRYLAATSMDKTVSILNVKTGKCVQSLTDHKHYIQGVSWDPKDELLVSQSSDQRVLIYSVAESETECKISGPVGRMEKENNVSFHPESFPSFFRRLRFSPDGAVLIVPAARFHAPDASNTSNSAENAHEKTSTEVSGNENTDKPVADATATNTPTTSTSDAPAPAAPAAPEAPAADAPNEPTNGNTSSTTNTSNESSDTECALVYTRGDLKVPSAILPLNKPSLEVKFNPIYFERTTSTPLIDLPHRFVYAIATTNSVFLYSSESDTPLGMVSNLHYSSITDITWTPDGRLLLITSIDGFCSCIRFEKDELGVPLAEQPGGPVVEQAIEEPKPVAINTLSVRRKK